MDCVFILPLLVVWLVGCPLVRPEEPKALPPAPAGCTSLTNTPWQCFLDGYTHTFSRLLVHTDAMKYAIPLMKRSETFKYPADGSPGLYQIDYILVVNKMKPNEQGTVTLVEGGVGSEKAVFKLESKRGKGYHFDITIRGVLVK